MFLLLWLGRRLNRLCPSFAYKISLSFHLFPWRTLDSHLAVDRHLEARSRL